MFEAANVIDFEADWQEDRRSSTAGQAGGGGLRSRGPPVCGSLGARTKPNLSLSHQTWTLSARAVGLDVSEGRYKSPAYLDTAKLRLTTLYLEATKAHRPGDGPFRSCTAPAQGL